VVPAAQASQKQYGVPASVTIAQAILESGWGKSKLAAESNNFFGVKFNSHMPGAGYVELPTKEIANGSAEIIEAEFQKYDTAEQGFNAHAYLLASLPRYSPAMKECGDPFEFATQLAACGYSTNPNYANELARLMTEFRLTQYDAKA
jgi:flagellum-specific peptidoglycan hydrolase FlgJ